MYNINDVVLLIGLAIILPSILLYFMPNKQDVVELDNDEDVNNYFFGGAMTNFTKVEPSSLTSTTKKIISKKTVKSTIKRPVNKIVNKKLTTNKKSSVKIAKKK